MSIIGTELKLNVSVEPMNGIHLAQCDFECEFFRRGNKSNGVIVAKDAMIKIDDDNYIARINSQDIGVGPVMMTITVHVPDPDFDDGYRTERDTVWTGVTIKPDA